MQHALFSTCDLCDAHELEDPLPMAALPPVFRDYGGVSRFSGQASTIRCFEDITRIRQAVETPGEGRVLVIDGGGSLRRALVGGRVAAAAARNGWSGIVVHGAARDEAEMRAVPLGVRALGLMPLRGQLRDEGQRDIPVLVAGVPVRPGDWIYADEDGILVATRALI